ncbi:hypothetical protein K470DRAFT_260270 [Piedraia hortae CBS 480.64]|uniref:Calcium-channel protein CCH1 n=1 Tax=Piedraia hortae CBS 480.64 TaxID=1314780 RepID=A0A6A7BSS1_9PEZI|nr:hypothetical protein K470DRAFT_260270 [Piedraia hortae CBS 480.64]
MAAHRRDHSEDYGIPLQELDDEGAESRRSADVSGTSYRVGRHTPSLSGRIFPRKRSRDGRKYAPLDEGLRAMPAWRPGSASRMQPLEQIDSKDAGAELLTPGSDWRTGRETPPFAGLSRSPYVEDGSDGGSVQNTPPESPDFGPSGPRLRSPVSSDDVMMPINLYDPPELPLGQEQGEEDLMPLTVPAPPPRFNRGRLGKPAAVHSVPGTIRRTRLGDDLRDPEAAFYATGVDRVHLGRKRSLSPMGTSTLGRTGTIFRKMSQRVVNISNESDVAEREINRRTSVRPHSIPSVPPLPSIPSQDELPAQAPEPRTEESKVPYTTSAQEISAAFPNPLRGKSLGFLSSHSTVRRRLLDLLVDPFFEPFILLLIVLQTILLAVNSAKDVSDQPKRPQKWGDTKMDWALLGIFVIYTFEAIIKILVSGFIFNPKEYSTIDRSVGVWKALSRKANELFSLHRQPTESDRRVRQSVQPGLLRAFTAGPLETMIIQGPEGKVLGNSRQAQQYRLAHRAFLRHSFNRLDFLAVVSFWIHFSFSFSGTEAAHHINVFRMLSCLRILRLLNITGGTTVILRSLKRAAPMLLHIALLIGFFWLLFAIIGLQSFKSSLRRTCVWNWQSSIYPNESEWASNGIAQFQFCGGWIAPNKSVIPWVTAKGVLGASSPKGYYCPVNSVCVEGDNPYNGTVGFDNILQSVEMIFVVMTGNTYSDFMYYLTQSDYLLAAMFFAFAIVILTLWLINLLIAVITTSFHIIREESRSSAFGTEEVEPDNEGENDLHQGEEDNFPARRRASVAQQIYEKSYWAWIGLIIYGLVVQCLRTAYNSLPMKRLIYITELVVTLLLLVEILLRFIADWRNFHRDRRNLVDLGLVIITVIIQIPPIPRTRAYDWLTIFQILRIYRVVLAISITRDLLTLVLRHVSGVLNLILFVFLITFLASIFASELFRGELPSQDSDGNTIQVPFNDIYNSFLGMYQILSSENWTTVVFNVTRLQAEWHTAWIAAIFFILWFTLAFFIVLNMFIAVIQENFEISEDQKRLQQIRLFLQQRDLGRSSSNSLALGNIFKFGKTRRQDPQAYGSTFKEPLLKDLKEIIESFMANEAKGDNGGGINRSATFQSEKSHSWVDRAKEWIKKVTDREPNPFHSQIQIGTADREVDSDTLIKEVMKATKQRKDTQGEYLRRHPGYNTTLFIFKPDNPVRRLCQRIVERPWGDKRIDGVEPSPPLWYAFNIFIYAAIVSMVVLACIATPLYQKEYFKRHGISTDSARYRSAANWFLWCDMGFAALFTLESAIKVIADGFFWTPNAYFRSLWSIIDGVVLITLWADVICAYVDPLYGSRAVSAVKALRALRLLNVSDNAMDTFHSIIVLGGIKVVSAAFVSLSLLIPFAIYGLNLFAGRMQYCNDRLPNVGPPMGPRTMANLTDCVNEVVVSPFNWDVLAPAVVTNSFANFDSFGNSLFTLFQIVSQEGWVDAMESAMAITGVFTMPSAFASQGNSVFFVVFNLMGTVFVLTLFVSVFMRSFTEQTGVAFLTKDQRSWLELRKMLKQVSPSKRPNQSRKRSSWQEWCYRRAKTKRGYWQRMVTTVLVAHLILLCLEWYPDKSSWPIYRNWIFLAFSLLYLTNVAIRIIGLTWTRFRRSAWDLYSLFSIGGMFVTTALEVTKDRNHSHRMVHNLFLVSIALLLIPRNSQLDQLFKTGAASLGAITNLMATWFVLFLTYAIALTQAFGLTRFGPGEDGNINFRTVPKALILLFRISMGEGWNQVMQDYANITAPRCTRPSNTLFSDDCGSKELAYVLFISWNILSMYIFVNLFISLIYESFSYVYQRGSGMSIVSRDEIRRYKEAWAVFDPDGKGFISKEQFPRLLGELSGLFDMRIYDGDFTLRALREDCAVSPPRGSSLGLPGRQQSADIDLAKLNRRLADLPIAKVRERRARKNLFYEDVLQQADREKGIAFGDLLLILAHYKIIDDTKSLKLDEALRRRARMKLLRQDVSRNTVSGFFAMLYWMHRLRHHTSSRRMTCPPQLDVPEIVVYGDSDSDHASNHTDGDRIDDSLPSSVLATPIDYVASDTADSLGPMVSVARSPRRNRNSFPLPERPPSPRTPPNRPTPRSADGTPLSWYLAAAINQQQGSPSPINSLSPEAASLNRSRSNSSVSEIGDFFQNSAWGASMRRSFTKRGGSKRSSAV